MEMRKSKSSRGRVKLDALDRRILDVLQVDNQVTSERLAEMVNSSGPTCLRRTRRLRQTGVIWREAAIVDPFKVGRSLIAFVEVVLERQGEALQRGFERRMAEEQAVTQCYMTSGGVDFMLIVNVADIPEYHAFLHRVLAGDENIRNFRSLFALSRSKFETSISFEAQEPSY
jgi:Lrp/AsnC family transcriptional regulator, leucine-responsive regulatory protein